MYRGEIPFFYTFLFTHRLFLYIYQYISIKKYIYKIKINECVKCKVCKYI